MPTIDELQAFLSADFPHATVRVESAGERRAVVRQPVGDEHLRPGGTISGPTLMAVADTAAYIAILATYGLVPLAVTTSLNITFMRKPAPGRAILGVAELLKVGKRLAVAEVRLSSEGDPELVAHAVVTYSIPPPPQK